MPVVYICLHKDRHIDLGVTAFSDKDKAIQYAQSIVDECLDDSDKEMMKEEFGDDWNTPNAGQIARLGCVFYTVCSTEGDNVSVREVRVTE